MTTSLAVLISVMVSVVMVLLLSVSLFAVASLQLRRGQAGQDEPGDDALSLGRSGGVEEEVTSTKSGAK